MASYEQISRDSNYILVAIRFDDQRFDQLITTSLVADEVSAFIQAYADEYEFDWKTANTDLSN